MNASILNQINAHFTRPISMINKPTIEEGQPVVDSKYVFITDRMIGDYWVDLYGYYDGEDAVIEAIALHGTRINLSELFYSQFSKVQRDYDEEMRLSREQEEYDRAFFK
tara:strand:- start:12817 stop:13143 length:327 start_codon:yes stop_codon:yes gene_type:complete